jgi:hypothetical protein
MITPGIVMRNTTWYWLRDFEATPPLKSPVPHVAAEASAKMMPRTCGVISNAFPHIK